MSTIQSPRPLPKPPVDLVNVLPYVYKTWLKLYDSLPVELRQEKLLRYSIEASRAEFIAAYPEQAETAAMLVSYRIMYRIDREWMLARIAEELLPSRMRKDAINSLEQSLHQASKYDSGANFYKAIELLAPAWAVSLDE